MTDFKKDSKKADASAMLQEDPVKAPVKADCFCIAPGHAITSRRGMLKEGDEVILDDCVSRKSQNEATPAALDSGKKEWDKRLKRGDIIKKT